MRDCAPKLPISTTLGFRRALCEVAGPSSRSVRAVILLAVTLLASAIAYVVSGDGRFIVVEAYRSPDAVAFR